MSEPSNFKNLEDMKDEDFCDISINPYSIYNALSNYKNGKSFSDSPKPLRCVENNSFVRRTIHDVALMLGLLSVSYGTYPNRYIVIWNDRDEELQKLRNTIEQFSKSNETDRLEFSPQPPEVRFAARRLAEQFGVVGMTEGLNENAHTVLWKTADRVQIASCLREFAHTPVTEKHHDVNDINAYSSVDSNEILHLPPLSGSLLKFATMTAADLGLYLVKSGEGEDSHLIAYKYSSPKIEILRSKHVYDSIRGTNSIITTSDILRKLKAEGLPESYATSLLRLAQKTGTIDFETFNRYLSSKERQLRTVFNAMDTDNTGFISFDKLPQIFRSLNIEQKYDHTLIESFKKQDVGNSSGLCFEQLSAGLALVSPSDIYRAVYKSDELRMAATSSGFQATISKEDKKELGQKGSLVWTVSSSLSGALANALSRTIVAPFERVRLQMAVDPLKYKNMIDCLRTLYLTEGLKGLWRGNVLNVIRIAPQGAIAFLCKDLVKEIFPQSVRNTPVALAVASMLSGAICMSSVYPLDFVRGRMTTCPGVYKSWQDALVQIYRQGGVKALFEGVNHSNSWAAVYYGVQFFAYDSFKKGYINLMTKFGKTPETNTTTGLVFGALSGCFCVSAAYPFELIRRKLQVQGFGGRPVKYDGWVDCFKKVIRTEGGYRGLYKGLGANMFKTPPSIAITFAAYEYLMKHAFRQKT